MAAGVARRRAPLGESLDDGDAGRWRRQPHAQRCLALTTKWRRVCCSHGAGCLREERWHR